LAAVVLSTGWAVVAYGQATKEDVSSLPARPAPRWITDGIVYQIWLRSFTPEGTLKAAAARLADVAELGATIVYLSPVQLQDTDMRREFWSTRQKASTANNPRNPYRIADYGRVDPEYGTEEDLRAFIQAAHKLGLRVLMDMVYCHTGPGCVLTRNPDFYHRDPEGKPAQNQWNFLRLNFGNPELRRYLIANMRHWLQDVDVDGFRCDVAALVPLDFWEEARRQLDSVRPELGMLAESDTCPAEQLKAFDLSYGSWWYHRLAGVAANGEPATNLRAAWEKMGNRYPRGARFTRYVDNHDKHRAHVVFGERGARAASVVNFTIDGVPYLYNGEEIGDATPQDLFSHWPIRWEAAGLPKQAEKLAFYKRLCRLRRDEPVLSNGEVVWLDNDQAADVLSFLRRADGQEIIVAVNLRNTPRKARLTLPEKSAGAYVGLFEKKYGSAAADGSHVELPSFGFFLGKSKRDTQ